MLHLDPAADAIRGHTAALCALAPLLGADGARVIRLGAKKATDAATPAEAHAIIAKVEAALRGSLSRRAARIAAGTEASADGIDGLAAQVALGETCSDPSEYRPMHQRLHELAEAARIIARTTGTEPAPEEEVVPEVAAPKASPEEPAQEEATGLFQPRTFEAVWEDVPVVSGVSSRGMTGNQSRNTTTDDRGLATQEIVAESVNSRPETPGFPVGGDSGTSHNLAASVHSQSPRLAPPTGNTIPEVNSLSLQGVTFPPATTQITTEITPETPSVPTPSRSIATPPAATSPVSSHPLHNTNDLTETEGRKLRGAWLAADNIGRTPNVFLTVNIFADRRSKTPTDPMTLDGCKLRSDELFKALRNWLDTHHFRNRDRIYLAVSERDLHGGSGLHWHLALWFPEQQLHDLCHALERWLCKRFYGPEQWNAYQALKRHKLDGNGGRLPFWIETNHDTLGRRQGRSREQSEADLGYMLKTLSGAVHAHSGGNVITLDELRRMAVGVMPRYRQSAERPLDRVKVSGAVNEEAQKAAGITPETEFGWLYRGERERRRRMH